MSSNRQPNTCPYCENVMAPSEMTCHDCNVSIRAEFGGSPLSSLPTEHQRFIEMFVLASGSLKEIAGHAGVSYPTVRNRLDRVIEALRAAMLDSSTDSKNEGSAAKRASTKATDAADEPTAAEIIKRIT